MIINIKNRKHAEWNIGITSMKGNGLYFCCRIVNSKIFVDYILIYDKDEHVKNYTLLAV